MKRATKITLWAVGLLLLTMSPLAIAQQLLSDPVPALPTSILGPKLIVWSQLQKPQPVPQPLPDPPSAKEGEHVSRSSSSSSPEESSSSTLIGRIVKDGSSFVLKVAKDEPYQLEDQQNAGNYENREVKIHGRLDETSHLLLIERIDSIF